MPAARETLLRQGVTRGLYNARLNPTSFPAVLHVLLLIESTSWAALDSR